MKTAIAKLESVGPYSQSRHYDVPKLDKELPKAYEERTWRHRCHVNEDGNIIIPPTSFKNCVADAAKFLSVQIPGKGKATWTKHFDAGVLVLNPLVLPVTQENVEAEWLFVPSDGRPGGGKRVDKCFPIIRKWAGSVTFHVLDDTITSDVFRYHLEQAGQLIGIGRFRPRNRGYYGRFRVTDFKWQNGTA